MFKTHLRAFHAVARYGGFTAAAAQLHVSQPTLSAQVRLLEDHYGVELFHRAGRQTSLSSAGRELFAVTTLLTKYEAEAEDLLGALGGLEAGSLRLAAVGPFHAIDMIVAFRARHPGVKVEVQFGNSQQSFERLLLHDADIAIIADVPTDPRIVALPYSTHDVVVFVNSDHPFYARDSLSIRDLAGRQVVHRERGSTTRTAVEAALREHGLAVETVLELGSREGVWKAVNQGLGLGFVADFEFVAQPNLRAIPFSDVRVRTSYHIAVHVDRTGSRLIRAFCDCVFRPRDDTR